MGNLNTSGVVNILNRQGNSIGTGFFYDNVGNVLTCFHVLKEIDENNGPATGTSIRVRIPVEQIEVQAQITYLSPKNDIAILKVSSVVPKVYYTIRTDVPAAEESLKTCGFPEGNPDIIIEEVKCLGVVENDRLQLCDADKVAKGFSGAPLLDSEGFAVGMIVETGSKGHAGKIDVSDMAVAISASHIINHIAPEQPATVDTNRRGAGNYLQYVKQKTNSLDFKGIEYLANLKGKSTTLRLYATLFVKGRSGISDDEIPLEDIVSNTRGIIIKGNPGSGKSTFIKYYVSKELERQLSEKVSPADKILPFIIQLEPFGRYIDNEKNIDGGKAASELFVQYLLHEYPQPGFSFTKENLTAIFEEGRGWLLFDGFDEVDSNSAKQRILNLIDLLYDYWSSCKFIITSRPFAIEEYTHNLGDFQVEFIDELHKAQMEEYIKSLANLCKTDQKTIDENGLVNIIFNSDLYELARTPVMLTFICLIFFANHDIPENRLEIIDKTISWLIETVYSDEEEQDKWMAQFLNIANKMFIEADKPQKEIPSGNLYDIMGRNGKKREILNQLTQVGIIIKAANKNNYVFWHFCFEEYLAAKKLCEMEINQGDSADLIISKWFNPEWHEVIVLFCAALMQESKNALTKCIDKVCGYLLNLPFEKQIQGASLLGSILRELYPHTEFIRASQNWENLKSSIKCMFSSNMESISAKDLSNAATAYGLSLDERIQDFGSTFIKIKEGHFFIGAQNNRHCGRKYDPLATEYERPVKEVYLSEYEIRKYPITVSEYEKFINDSGYTLSKEIWSNGGFEWRNEEKISMPRNWRRQLHLRNSPVTGVSWYEAVAFCNWLTLSRQDGFRYNLPTEAQWEYAFFSCYDAPIYQKYRFNHYSDTIDIQTKTPIGIFPGPFRDDLQDMLGNVEEICKDSWCETLDDYPIDGTAYTQLEETGMVTRGGSTIRTIRLCRPTYRARCNKTTRYDTIGFRIVRQSVNT